MVEAMRALRVLIVVFGVLLLTGCAPSPDPETGLCGNCKTKAYTSDVGVCTDCNGNMASGMLKTCGPCANKRGQCPACNKPL
jgi:hypothetical protein